MSIPLTHYQTLNLPYTASKADISTAFHTFCKLHRQPGPNKIPHFSASQRFKELRDAYDMLIDSDDKKQYDLYLARSGVPEMVEKLKAQETKMREEGEPYLDKLERAEEMKREREEREEMDRKVREVNERGEEVYEGWGEEEVAKFKGRPKGPKVRGTNV